MNVATRVDEQGAGLYFVFTEDAYAVEEYHLWFALMQWGYDGTQASLSAFISERVAYRQADKAARDADAAQTVAIQPVEAWEWDL